jgi:hypothetical protein
MILCLLLQIEFLLYVKRQSLLLLRIVILQANESQQTILLAWPCLIVPLLAQTDGNKRLTNVSYLCLHPFMT